MASKRNLYRPAQVKDNVGQRQPRKTLAQGRLITNGGKVQGSLPAAVSLNASHVSNTSGNVSKLHQTSLVQGQLEESLFSPRRAVPHISEPKSPQFGHPAGSLDLSDSDEEQSPGQRAHYQKPPEVLYVDASRQTVNPDVSEVDIRIGVDRSPVKIVCHSPTRTSQGKRNEELTPPSTRSTEAADKPFKHHMPVTVKTAGDHIDPLTAVQSVPMSLTYVERKVLQDLPTNYPQPNFDEFSDTEVSIRHSASKNDTMDSEDKMSVTSDNDTSSQKQITVTVTKHKVHGTKKVAKQATKTLPSSARKDVQKRPDTGKKKTGKFVPSRYMQASESKAKASLSARMDKSSFEKSKGGRSMDATPSVRKVARRVHQEESKTASNLKQPARPQTPDNQSVVSTGGKTSTPTMDGTLFSQDMDIDASAIHPEVSMLAGDNVRVKKSPANCGRTRSRLKPDLHDDLMGQSILSNVSNQSMLSAKPQKKLDAKSLQQQTDLLWEYNQQWAFLEAKAKKTLHDQERQAMAQIQGLFEEVEKLRKVKMEKEQHLSRLKHTNTADHMAEVQRQCLGPVIGNLPSLQKQYRSLAFALDTTRHQIPTKDVHLPEDEDQHQAKLEAQLLESERLLGEISASTRQEVPRISEMADTLVAMETAVEGMGKELKKSGELLAATETLTMHECSLRVQEIQLFDQS